MDLAVVFALDDEDSLGGLANGLCSWDATAMATGSMEGFEDWCSARV